MTAAEAYAEVERITRRRARNFAWGIMVLPRPKRQAIAAIYAYARRVDDLADGELPPSEKRARLEQLAAELDRPAAEDATLVALADARERYAIPREPLEALVAGGLQDLERHRYEDFDELADYCRKVAGAVGLACLPVYGVSGSEPRAGSAAACGPASRRGSARFERLSGSEPQTGSAARNSASQPGSAPFEPLSGSEPQALAERLGVALQLINILRDVEEDLRLGRVYLPQDELSAFGVSEAELADGRARGSEAWRRLATFQAERARGWLADGVRLLDVLDRRSALCVGTFASIYRATLDEIEARGYDVFDGEVRPSGRAKLAIVARGLLG